MGTVVLNVQPTGYLEKAFKEFLYETFTKLEGFSEDDVYGKTIREEKIEGAYRNLYMLDFEGKKVTILANPRMYFNNLPKYRLIIHLSHFLDFKTFKKFLVKLCKIEIAKYIYYEALIVRLDNWFDSKNPYRSVKSVMHKNHIKACKEYSGGVGNLKGIYYGSPKSTHYYFVYQKVKKSKNLNEITRIEKRFKGRACPIKHLAQYSQLANMRLLDDLFCENPIDGKLLHNMLFGKIAVNEKIRKFLNTRHYDGLQCAKREFCRDKNFHDQVWAFYISNCKSVDLSKLLQRRIKKFVAGQEEVWI